MKSFIGLLVADFKQFFRDRTALFFTFAFPVLFMVIFGLVFGGNGDIRYNIGVANRDVSGIGEQITGALKQVPVFEITDGLLDQQLEELNQGSLRAVIEIPPDIQSSLTAGEPVNIKVYYDPSQTTSAQIILSVLNETIGEINQQITQQPVLLRLVQESVSLHDLRNIDYIVPGILAMSIMILGLFGSLTLVEWREKMVLKRFAATPVSRSMVVYSQIVYRLILSVAQAVIIVAIAYFAFNVPVVGSWLLLAGIVIFATLTFISLGYLAVSRSRTVEGAMPIIQIIQFPMLFLSGIFFPVEFMPDFMRPIVNAIPVTYLGDALRQVMVDATPLHSMTTNIIVLAAWLVASLLLAIKLFRWD
ncbi:MAG: ABC transporter permease [Dehalococcoidia bacterium]|nr:ABC transporter permease [Dehalococcoidia bacterium]